MKKLMIAVSAIALSAGMAQAQNATTVQQAWSQSAHVHQVATPMTHNDPSDADPIDPAKPTDLTIDRRDFKNPGPANGQASYVDQVGSNNEADVNQTAAPVTSVSDIIQLGNDNKASVLQRSGAGQHYAVATQNGNNNGAAIRQHSDTITGASYADIEQGGDGTNPNMSAGGPADPAHNNWASIDQGIGAGGGDVASFGNEARIAQGTNGPGSSDNVAAIAQRGDEMRSEIEQDGVANTASILQTGNGGGANGTFREQNEARITQDGDDNLGVITQDGEYQRASIDQVGGSNSASIEQDGNTTNSGSLVLGNTALIDQDGDLNTSTILQEGNSNMASNTQDGNENDSSIWQDGNGNMAAVVQTGNLNFSALDQIGNNNAASVVQNGGDFSDIQQTGNNNVAAVAQN